MLLWRPWCPKTCHLQARDSGKTVMLFSLNPKVWELWVPVMNIPVQIEDHKNQEFWGQESDQGPGSRSQAESANCVLSLSSCSFRSSVDWIMLTHIGTSLVVRMVENSPANAGDIKRYETDPWVEKIPWRRAWKPTPVSWPGESQGQRQPVSQSPWGYRVGHDWSDLACTHSHSYKDSTATHSNENLKIN